MLISELKKNLIIDKNSNENEYNPPKKNQKSKIQSFNNQQSDEKNLYQQLNEYNPPPIVLTEPLVVDIFPITCTCCYCGSNIKTDVFEETSSVVLIISIIFMLFFNVLGIVIGILMIIFLKDNIHFCPNCKKELFKKNFM
jgi:hypothetical protein